MAERCENCRFFDLGSCLWRPPPAVRRIISMAHAEPATHIDWEAVAAEPPKVALDDWCGEFQKGQTDDD